MIVEDLIPTYYERKVRETLSTTLRLLEYGKSTPRDPLELLYEEIMDERAVYESKP